VLELSERTQPVVLADEERVLRLCFRANANAILGLQRPRHTDPDTGRLYEDAVQMRDLMLRGFSLQRIALYSVAQGERAAAEQQARKPDGDVQLLGGVVAQVSNVHAIVDDDGVQVFEVQAHPTNDDPSHAMVKSSLPRSKLLKFRPTLVACFDPVAPLSELCN